MLKVLAVELKVLPTCTHQAFYFPELSAHTTVLAFSPADRDLRFQRVKRADAVERFLPVIGHAPNLS